MRFNHLSDALKKSQQIKFPSQNQEAILKSATQSLAGVLRQYLITNYGSSGINTRSGALRNIVAASKIWYEKGRVRYSFPTTSAKIATYGAALQYGWTTGASNALGAKAKKSLKKFALKKGVTSFGNDVKVIPPKPYYYVTDFQMQSFMQMLKVRVNAILATRSQKSLVG